MVRLSNWTTSRFMWEGKVISALLLAERIVLYFPHEIKLKVAKYDKK